MLSLTEEFINESKKKHSRPCELVDVYLGAQDSRDKNTYHFCTNNKKVSFWNLDGSPAVYKPLRISRAGIRTTSQLEIDTFSADFDNTDRAWSSWLAVSEIRNKRLAVRKVFLDLLTGPEHTKILFDGVFHRFSSVTREKATIEFKNRLKTLNRKTGVLQGIQCTHVFGDEGCKFDENSTKVSNQVVGEGSEVGYILDSARGEADGYWRNGIIIFTDGQNAGEIRSVKNFIFGENKILLDYSLPNTPAAGDKYDLFQGCDKAYDTCKDRFSNQANFGGCKDLPQMINPIINKSK